MSKYNCLFDKDSCATCRYLWTDTETGIFSCHYKDSYKEIKNPIDTGICSKWECSYLIKLARNHQRAAENR